jgi:hypothetical protein
MKSYGFVSIVQSYRWHRCYHAFEYDHSPLSSFSASRWRLQDTSTIQNVHHAGAHIPTQKKRRRMRKRKGTVGYYPRYDIFACVLDFVGLV